MPPKKQIRPNKCQIRLLLEYMREHPDLAAGKFSGVMGQAKMQREWEGLKDLLNEQGPARNAEQWKVTWRDQKVKARKEGGMHHRALRETGNRDIPELSETTALVLETIGAEMALGLGRAESSIGFSSAVEAPTLMPESSSIGFSSAVEAPTLMPESSSIGFSSAVEAPTLMPESSSIGVPKRKKKTLLPPERFLCAQQELNQISQNQLQLLNDTLVSINSTLLHIQKELTESNRLRMLQIQGQVNHQGKENEFFEVYEED